MILVIRSRLATIKAVFFVVICISMLVILGFYFYDVSPLSNRPGVEVPDRKDLMKSWHFAVLDNFFQIREVSILVRRFSGQSVTSLDFSNILILLLKSKEVIVI